MCESGDEHFRSMKSKDSTPPPPYSFGKAVRFDQGQGQDHNQDNGEWVFGPDGFWLRTQTDHGGRKIIEFGVGPSNWIGPDVSFCCTSVIPAQNSAERSSLENVCRSVVSGLAGHRRLRGWRCNCDFALFGDRFTLALPKRKYCCSLSLRGRSVRAAMLQHDKLCSCGCFGEVLDEKTHKPNIASAITEFQDLFSESFLSCDARHYADEAALKLQRHRRNRNCNCGFTRFLTGTQSNEQCRIVEAFSRLSVVIRKHDEDCKQGCFSLEGARLDVTQLSLQGLHPAYAHPDCDAKDHADSAATAMQQHRHQHHCLCRVDQCIPGAKQACCTLREEHVTKAIMDHNKTCFRGCFDGQGTADYEDAKDQKAWALQSFPPPRSNSDCRAPDHAAKAAVALLEHRRKHACSCGYPERNGHPAKNTYRCGGSYAAVISQIELHNNYCGHHCFWKKW